MTVQKITADLSELPRQWSPDVIASRVETGPLQINDDWPSVHIRGDTAGWYAMQLDQAIELLKAVPLGMSDLIVIAGLQQLSDLLTSCIVRYDHNTVQEVECEESEEDIPLGC